LAACHVKFLSAQSIPFCKGGLRILRYALDMCASGTRL